MQQLYKSNCGLKISHIERDGYFGKSKTQKANRQITTTMKYF